MGTLCEMARKYELRKRAQRQADTRRRIIEAAVELHRTVGPARTTISAIAELAGIERKTFYRHFPDPDEMFEACSAHFRALNPLPDPHAWESIADPSARLRHGLLAAYGYYRAHEAMMNNILRDRELGVPVGDGFLRHRAAAKSVLAEPFAAHGARRRSLDAALEVALDLRTWQQLARCGLSDRQAIELTTALVDKAVTSEPQRRSRGDG